MGLKMITVSGGLRLYFKASEEYFVYPIPIKSLNLSHA